MNKKIIFSFGIFIILLMGIASAGVPTYTGVNNGISWFKDKVGFGTDTPTEAVDVVGNIKVSGTSNLGGDVNFTSNTLRDIGSIRQTNNMYWGNGANPFKVHFGYAESPYLYGALMTIRPYTKTTGALILKQANENQSVNLMEVQDKDGNNINFALDEEGKLPTNLYIHKADPQIVLQQDDGGRNYSLYAEGEEYRLYDSTDGENQQYWDGDTEYTQLNGWMKIVNSDSSGQTAFEIDQNRPWDGLKISSTNQNGISMQDGGVLASGRAMINLYDDNAQTTGLGLIYANMDNASSTIPVSDLINSGSAPTIKITQNQNVKVMDFDGCTDGGVTHTTIAGSIKVEMPNGAVGFINLYS